MQTTRTTRSSLRGSAANARDGLRSASTEATAAAEPWLERLGRVGFAAKGIVYLVIGVLAIRAAFDTGGETSGPQGALATIAQQPIGRTLLWVVAAGLVGYALWRFVQAIRDTDGKGTDAKGLVFRVGYAVSGVIHVSLALAAARIARGGAANDGAQQRDLTAELMSQPAGTWLVVLVGLVVLGVAVQQFRRAYTASFQKHLRSGEMDADEERWAVISGRVGYAARGVTFAIIGTFLAIAGWRADPSQAKGLGEALQTLEAQPFGPALLALVGLGLVCYAVFQLVLARYRRVLLH